MRACTFLLALITSTGIACTDIAGTGVARAQDEARAEELLARAARALDDAAFAEVDAALDRATLAPMTRDELLRWLELRALVAYADDRLGAIEEALRGYASLVDEDAPPPASFPTPLRARLAEIRAQRPAIQLGVELAITESDDTRRLALPVQVVDDPGHLVRRVRVTAVIDDEDEARTIAPGESVRVPGDVHRDARVAYWLEALGPGGALLLREGSAEAPIERVVPARPRSNDEPLIVGVVTASVIVVAGAIVLAWGAAENWWRGHDTRVEGPALLRF